MSKHATLLLASLLMTCGIAHAYVAAAPAAGIDFYQFWVVGRAISQTRAVDLYSTQARRELGSHYFAEALRSTSPRQRAVGAHRRVLETTATPFLYTAFSAVSNDDYDQCLGRFRAILLGAFVLSVLGLAQLARHSTANAFLVVALLAEWFEPLASDLRVGNVGSLQLLQVVIYAYLQLYLTKHARHWVSGLWLGLSLAFKPNLAPLVAFVLLWLLLNRNWSAWFKTMVGIAVGVGGAVVVSAIAIGSFHPWLEWVSALVSIPDANITTMLGNFSPFEVLRPYCGRMTGIFVSAFGIGLVTWGLASRLRARHIRTSESQRAWAQHDLLWVLAIGCLLPILAVRLAWLHYFVLTTPALLLGLARLHQAPVGGRSRANRARCTWVVLTVVGAWSGLAINPLASVGRSYTMQAYGVMVILATVASLAALCVSTSKSDADAAAPVDGAR